MAAFSSPLERALPEAICPQRHDGWPWPFEVVPEIDELLSAFLCRVAHVHGATPYAFACAYGGGKPFWARDVDRLVSRVAIDAIWSHARLPMIRVEELSLEPWMARLMSRPSGLRPTAVVPWINVVGVFHRMRRLYGLTFCQECLAESGTFTRAGRLAFVIACERHGCAMLDACPSCDAPVQPHRGADGLWRCSQCLVDMRRTGMQRRSPDVAAASRLQARLFQSLAAHDDGGNGADLRAARSLAAAVVTARRRSVGTACGPPVPVGMRIETARADARADILGQVSAVLDGWPVTFRRLARVGRLCYTDFTRQQPLPPWMAAEVEGLPRRPNGRRVETRSTLADRLNALRREATPNWRVRHADMMLRAARRRA